jgi:uncharacterized protein YgiM (DUF1202 family)
VKRNNGVVILISALAAVALACNFPTVSPTPAADINATVTSFLLTQAIAQPTSFELPEFTATITVAPAITSTLPPSVPMVSVSVNTNCRTGPGISYDLLAGLLVGEKAEVVGKYTSVFPNYWVIRMGSVTCWLWGQYATVEGDVSNIPEMVPPPSPTPTSTYTPTTTPTITLTPTNTPTATATP